MRLVYLSPVPWASFTQRPHQFVRWLHARTGCEVLWVEPYPTRLPIPADLIRKRPAASMRGHAVPSWMTVTQPRALPVEPLPASGALNRLLWNGVLDQVASFAAPQRCWIGIGKPSELALQVLAATPAEMSFYDAMDDFPAFYDGLSRAAMERRERVLARQVDRILVSSTVLSERFASHAEKVLLARNACAVAGMPPPRTPASATSSPVIGYVGTIGHWFDWDLVVALARQHPDVRVRIVGPVYVGPPGALPRNVELAPPCPHEQAIQAMLSFSVGLIPFKKSELTASVDPIKYYEYRALGLPVLTTAFGEMASRRGEDPGVFYADRPAELASVVRRALSYRGDADDVEAFRQINSWEARFDRCGLLAGRGRFDAVEVPAAIA